MSGGEVGASSWARVGGWSGIAAVAAYLLAAFAPVPDRLGYVLAFAFGPLVAVASVGMRRVLAAARPGRCRSSVGYSASGRGSWSSPC